MSLRPYLHLDDSLDGLDVGEYVPLSGDAEGHLTRVLRLQPGADVEVSDGAGRSARAVLVTGGVELTAPVHTEPPRSPTISVAQAPPKGRRFDDVVRQLTELDVDVVTPLRTARGVVRPEGERLAKAASRWEAVARAASEQSRRSWRLRVTGMRTLDEVVAADGRCLLAHPGGTPLPCALTRSLGRDVSLVVGPEGGFSDEELAGATARGAELVGLGRSVLRTEHAAAAGVSVIAATLGRWA